MVTFTINIPPMLVYIPAPWILWHIKCYEKHRNPQGSNIHLDFTARWWAEFQGGEGELDMNFAMADWKCLDMLGKPAGWAVCYSLLFKEFNKCMCVYIYIYIHTYIHIIEAKQQKHNFWQGIQDLPCNKPPFGGEFFHGSRIVSESSTLLYALSIIQRIERNKNKSDLCHHKSKPCTCILHRANMSTSALNQLSQTSDVLEWHCLEAAMASNRHVVDHVVYVYIYIHIPQKPCRNAWYTNEMYRRRQTNQKMTMKWPWDDHDSTIKYTLRITHICSASCSEVHLEEVCQVCSEVSEEVDQTSLSLVMKGWTPFLTTATGWWFGSFFILPYNKHSQLTFIFFRGVSIPPTR